MVAHNPLGASSRWSKPLAYQFPNLAPCCVVDIKKLPLEFYPILLYTVGNITGNVTGISHFSDPTINYLVLSKEVQKSFNKPYRFHQFVPKSPYLV
jgi:hypothetical protein